MKETEKMKDLWSWHRNKKCSGDWRVEKDAVCVAQHGHQQLPLCPAFSRSFLHLLSTLAPLPCHFLSVFIAGPPFLFLSLPRPIFLPTSFTLCYLSFFLFPPSFTLLPPLFFCISPLYLSPVIPVLFLYLSLKKSPPRTSTCECLYLELSSPHLYVCSPWDAHTDTVYSLVHINWTCCESVSQQETDTEKGSLLFPSQLLQPL